MGLYFRVGAATISGSRHANQDRLVNGAGEKEGRMLFAVFDGVTNSATIKGDGAVAAEAAMNLLRDSDPGTKLSDAVREVHRRMLEMKRYVPIIGETTVVAARITGNVVEIANVGDSPAHLLRAGKMRRLYTPDLGHFGGLVQALGFDESMKVHGRSMKIIPDDVIVLASDGLMKSIKSYIWPSEKNMGKYVTRTILTYGEIMNAVESSSHMDAAAERLLKEAAKKRPDIDDDRTVIVIRALRAD